MTLPRNLSVSGRGKISPHFSRLAASSATLSSGHIPAKPLPKGLRPWRGQASKRALVRVPELSNLLPKPLLSNLDPAHENHPLTIGPRSCQKQMFPAHPPSMKACHRCRDRIIDQ